MKPDNPDVTTHLDQPQPEQLVPDDGQIELTVLLPCLNEAETLAVCVEKAQRSIAELGIRGEVLVSDNGSTDGSQEIALRGGARVSHAPIRGYGGALLNGIAQARGRYVIMADADDSYDLTNLGPFVEKLRAGHDVVMGNRFRGGIRPGAMPFLHRYLGNPVLSWLGRILFHLRGIGDFHCGIRGFNRDRIRALDLCMPGMEFASELVVRSSLSGYDMVEVPTTLHPDGRSRPPHLRTWRDGWRHLRFLLIFAPRATLIRPGLLMLLVGLVGTAVLAPGPVTLGSVRFDLNALVYFCLSVLVGTQLTLLGGLSEVFRQRERLVPDDVPSRWGRLLKLEISATAGLVLVLAGLVGTIAVVTGWGRADFGDLSLTTVRYTLVSATLVALGIVIMFSGLLSSLLTLTSARSAPAKVSPSVPSQAGQSDGDDDSSDAQYRPAAAAATK